MHGCLFVAHQNMFETILFIERVVNVQDRATWIAKDEFDFFLIQARDNNVRTCHGFGVGVCGGVGRSVHKTLIFWLINVEPYTLTCFANLVKIVACVQSGLLRSAKELRQVANKG
jgi:hypothetical protein